MKRLVIYIFFFILYKKNVFSQCSVCTKTAEQLGRDMAEGLNFAIVYLMIIPFIIAGTIYYFWRKNNVK